MTEATRLADEASQLENKFRSGWLVKDTEAWEKFCFRNSGAIVAALRAMSQGQREAIARIIAPATWSHFEKQVEWLKSQPMEADVLELAIKHERGFCKSSLVKADAILAALAPLAQEGETVAVPKAALEWLFGSQPDADGKWFGECREAISAMEAKVPRRFWWRSKFRSMIPTLSRPDGGSV